MVKIFANLIWTYIPGLLQKEVSRLFSLIFYSRWSRFFIAPYCFVFGLSSEYLERFQSESESIFYDSYSDFFKRKFKSPPSLESDLIWPCEGYVCDWGEFNLKNHTLVKGQKRDLNSIFLSHPDVTSNYFFINIFLHNHNYHRVHSPCDGQITRISKVPGDLIFLRPWFYKNGDVSYPAFRNERFIFEIKDSQNRPWFLAMIGGFGVGTIELAPQAVLGAKIKVGEEIGRFNLGSTVCLALPHAAHIQKFLQTVQVGQKIQII